MLMVLAFGIIKLSITFSYRRIFVTARGTMFDWTTKAAIAIAVLWTISCLIALILSCGIHFSAHWGNYQDYTRYCKAAEDIYMTFAISDLITDVMVLCLPLPVIWNLQMRIGRKLMVTGILATGAVSIVASIVKVILSVEIANVKSSTLDPDCVFLSSTIERNQLTRREKVVLSTMLYWATIEGGLGVIAACLPTLSFLISKVSLSSLLPNVRGALRLGSVGEGRRNRYPNPTTNLTELDTLVNPTAFTNNATLTCSITGNDGGLSRHLGDGIYTTTTTTLMTTPFDPRGGVSDNGGPSAQV
ncbi:hypothetical protein MMC07_005372 [Pseudocyphellaria aurata]|nr:hypothetical protein [Pseudocyphellaria aurata]